ncbi:XdhC family protein [Okeania sp. SIO2B3]|uniref:XdhC family protein n=1 Tax=Okeania sp. SIO2B3 TaxID=2607784 RepID=UPI0013BED2A2|nr:XdhC/CoxI family protein [Okeania sp. SIO2B3]NET45597.1 XdhC family protein [Okeania sp. SIO2B3]
MKELQDIIATYTKLKHSNETFALATIVKVAGSTYRRAGARMLMTAKGEMVGSLSGGCLEGDVLEQGQEVMSSGKYRLVTYDTTSEADIIWGLGMGCQGIVDIFIEPLSGEKGIDLMSFFADCLQHRQPGVLVTVFRSQAAEQYHLMLSTDGNFTTKITDNSLVQLLVDRAKTAQSSGKSFQISINNIEAFIEVIHPPLPLVIFGAGHDAIPVTSFAKQLGWYVTVLDCRPAYATSARFPAANSIVISEYEKLPKSVILDEKTVVVVMTHNYLYDLTILKNILPLPLRYLGILGPRRRTEKLLAEIPIDEQYKKRLYTPVGLDIGADNPQEIALAIIAEIQAVISNRSAGFLRHRNLPIHSQNNE